MLLNRGGFRFSPGSLFPVSTVGAWYDPSDLTTLFQDSAGTTPVTATGQTVGMMKDKSGNGNHATQAGAGKPTYQVDGSGNPFLSFDGVSNFLTATFTLAQPFDHISAIRQISWTSALRLFDGATVNTAGISQQTASPQLAMFAGSGWTANNSGCAIGSNAVLSARFNGASSSLIANNGAPTTGDAGVSADTGGLTLGACGGNLGFFANFALYGLVVRQGTMAAGDLANMHTYLGRKAGLAL